MKVTCPECGRTFDLLNTVDADEWTHGHDCEDEGSEFLRDHLVVIPVRF